MKTLERERRRKRIKTHVSMRERVVPKVVKKWLYKYHSSWPKTIEKEKGRDRIKI